MKMIPWYLGIAAGVFLLWEVYRMAQTSSSNAAAAQQSSALAAATAAAAGAVQAGTATTGQAGLITGSGDTAGLGITGSD